MTTGDHYFGPSSNGLYDASFVDYDRCRDYAGATTQSDTEAEEERMFMDRDRRMCGAGKTAIRRWGSFTPSAIAAGIVRKKATAIFPSDMSHRYQHLRSRNNRQGLFATGAAAIIPFRCSTPKSSASSSPLTSSSDGLDSSFSATTEDADVPSRKRQCSPKKAAKNTDKKKKRPSLDDDGASVYFRPVENRVRHSDQRSQQKFARSGMNKRQRQKRTNPVFIPAIGNCLEKTTPLNSMHVPEKMTIEQNDFLDPPRSWILQQYYQEQRAQQAFTEPKGHHHYSQQQQHAVCNELTRHHRRSIRRLMPEKEFEQLRGRVPPNAPAIISSPVFLDQRDLQLATTNLRSKAAAPAHGTLPRGFGASSSPKLACLSLADRHHGISSSTQHLPTLDEHQHADLSTHDQFLRERKNVDATYRNLIDEKHAQPQVEDNKENVIAQPFSSFTHKNGSESVWNKNNTSELEHLVPLAIITPSQSSGPDSDDFREQHLVFNDGLVRFRQSALGNNEETHFMEIDETKIYENIQRDANHRLPLPPLPWESRPVDIFEDEPTVYGRLVALSLLECARSVQPEPVTRGIPVAIKQLDELLGIDLKSTELLKLDPTTADQAEFAHSCAFFGSLVAKCLRQSQAQCSSKQQNWRVRRLHKILDRLKTGQLASTSFGVPKVLTNGSALLGKLATRHSRLQTLFRRVAARIF